MLDLGDLGRIALGFAFGARLTQETLVEDASTTIDTTAKVYDVAWAPDSGMVFGFRYEDIQLETLETGFTVFTDLISLNLGWQF